MPFFSKYFPPVKNSNLKIDQSENCGHEISFSLGIRSFYFFSKMLQKISLQKFFLWKVIKTLPTSSSATDLSIYDFFEKWRHDPRCRHMSTKDFPPTKISNLKIDQSENFGHETSFSPRISTNQEVQPKKLTNQKIAVTKYVSLSLCTAAFNGSLPSCWSIIKS